jgi:hypothetical protein
MTKIMIAIEITDGQIENAVNKLRDAMRKHRSEITSDVAQQVLGVENLGMMMFAPFRERAEVISNLIVRTTKVNRARTPQQVLDATGRKQYTNSDVVATMPRGEGSEAEVIFFKLGRYVSDNELEKEYELRGLKPADPYSLAAVNEADPAFADGHLNCTHWQDVNGKWCFSAFDRWGGERSLGVRRLDSDWYDGWWFAGLRK